MTPVRSLCAELILSPNENDWKIFKKKGVKCLIIANLNSYLKQACLHVKVFPLRNAITYFQRYLKRNNMI